MAPGIQIHPRLVHSLETMIVRTGITDLLFKGVMASRRMIQSISARFPPSPIIAIVAVTVEKAISGKELLF